MGEDISCNHGNRCHKWIILVAVLIITFTHLGVMNNFGTMFVAMLETFKEGRSVTATVQSLLYGFALGPGVLSGMLVSRYGVVKVSVAGSTLTSLGLILAFFANTIFVLDVCVGFISGVGISFIYISNTVALGYVFTGAQKQLVVSLMYTTNSIAGLAFPYFLKFSLQQYGLHGTFLILGGLLLNGYVVAFLYAYDSTINSKFKKLENNQKKSLLLDKEHAEISDKNTSNTKPGLVNNISTFISKLCTPSYILILTATAIINSSMSGYVVLVIDIFVSKGYSVQEGLLSFVPASIAGIISRILPGLVKMKHGFNSLIFPVLYCCCGAAGQFMIYVSSTYPTMLIANTLNFIALGGGISAAGVILVKIVDEQQLGVGMGLMMSTIGVLISVIGPLYGTLRDVTGSYDMMLLITGIVHVTAAILYTATAVVRRNSKHSHTNNRKTLSIHLVD